jgi:tetratricopeptide (TPR) repeat protein
LSAQERILKLSKENKAIFDDSTRPLAVQELFAGNKDLYKPLDGHAAASDNVSPHSTKTQSAAKAKTISAAASPKRGLSIITIAIRVSIGLIAAVLLVPISLYCISAMLAPQNAPPQTTVVVHTSTAAITEEPSASAANTEDEAVSWKLAQSYYKAKDYAKASATYSRLSGNLSLSDPTQAIWDGYLKLKTALCAYKLKDTATADRCFAKALQSSPPAIVALSNYYLAIIKNEQKLYSDARIRAYKALTLLETIDAKYSESLICDCSFLVAQTLTTDALLGRGQQLESPANWQQITFSEPLEHLEEAELQHIFQSSIETLRVAAMGPQIQKLDPRAGSVRYQVKCSQASVEELFAAFAAVGGQDIRWQCSYGNVSGKPVTIYLAAATQQKFFETAAGSIGLLASFEGNQTSVYDPAGALTITEHQKLLTPEAISAWQRFILAYRSDKRIADAHFAIGLLQHADNHQPTAIAEFRQVANRFLRSPLAAYSLFNAAKIKMDISDDSGAREYLKELCAQYPDSPVTDKAHLLLAQTSLTVGDYEHAQQIFRKVCNLNISPEYTLTATLGAAKCYFTMKDYALAADWLVRYAVLAKQSPDNAADLQTAYSMLAEADLHLGKLDDACRAYQSALSLPLSFDANFDIAMKLAAVYLRQENLVDALDTIEKIDLSQLSDRQVANVWLVKAQILASMNLPDRATELLAGRVNTVEDARIRSEMALQLARSYKALDNPTVARDVLCQALLHSEPGMPTAQLQCELADVCITLGDNGQAVTICSQILASSVPDDVRSRVRNLLGAAHANQKQYDKAAKAFSGTAQSAGAK